MTLRLLILGGTGEAQELYKTLENQIPDLKVVYSLSGATDSPVDFGAHMRIGGFGGIQGLVDHLEAHDFDALIDATHPFAERITAHAVAACEAASVPRLRLERAQWVLPAKTDAVFVPDAIEAANLLVRTTSESAFLTIGRKALSAFEGMDKTHLLVRVLDEPAEPLSLFRHTIVTGRPPFSVDEEEALMREHNIDTLVTKASGGDATRAKLDAAERVRARIILIRRPLPPDGDRVFSVEEAVDWVRNLNA
ncbi:cobalt-precorrin-6A reductase [Magnetovibrio sp. PR-2]|uniref:cobalt-precorrin-6A reductase n=1 Tax=Magnetovibrio sp. PR-2 TaxID=3120356 RepID=UPI002FCDF55E